MSWADDLAAMHHKMFGDKVALVAGMDPEVRKEYFKFRLRFLNEELLETMLATTPDDVVDGLIDLCVVAIGTLHAFGVDGQEAWRRVYEANMAKQPGANPNRPNKFGLPDLVKPAGWEPPTHKGNTGLLDLVFRS